MIDTTIRNAQLDDMVQLLQNQHARKLDVVAPASKIVAKHGNLVVSGTEPVLTDDGVTEADGTYRPTEVADEGLAGRLGIPRGYMRTMREQGRADLWDANVNGWLRGTDATNHSDMHETAAQQKPHFLRMFRGDVGEYGIARAVLSDRFGVIDNLDILMSALSGIRDAGVNVDIRQCDLSERRMYVRVAAPEVKALAPELLRGYRSPWTGAEGTDNPTVFAGFIISNSEVGNGSFSLTPQVVVQICNNGMTVKADALKAVHLGSKMDEGVIRWSDDTQRKQLDLITSRTKDAVNTFLDVDYVKQFISSIDEQAAVRLEKPDEKVRTVTKSLSFSDSEQEGVLSHFIQGGQPTAGGVLHAVTSFAQTIDSVDRSYQVEEKGLEALALAAR